MPTSYRLTLKGTLNLVPVENTWTINTDAADNSFSEAENIVSEVQSNGFVDAWLDCCPTVYVLESIECRGIVAELGGTVPTAAAVDSIVGSAGTRTGDVVSNQDGPLITYLSFAEPGERARVWKSFIPGITADDAIGDVISPFLLASIDTLTQAMEAGIALGGNTGQWVVLVRRLLDLTLPESPTNPIVNFVRAILAFGFETFVASQNRRRPNR